MTIGTFASARIQTGAFETESVLAGEGPPLLLLHGSGPGVTAMANWQGVIPAFAIERRVIAPDLLGFGSTERRSDVIYDFTRSWTDQIAALLDALDVERTDIIGNSFGGGIALAFASRFPERVARLVLMGSAGAPTGLTPALDQLWGYRPSPEAMREMLSNLVADQARVTPELVVQRYEASVRSDAQDAYAALFPPPRQRWLDALTLSDHKLANVGSPTLLLHGREDRVIPVASSLHLQRILPDAQLTIFDDCGHWVMVERLAAFTEVVCTFLGMDRH